MIKNIVFDIGNVLTDYSWKEFLEDRGFTGELFDRIVKASIMNPDWAEYDKGVISVEEIMQLFAAADPEIEQEIRFAYQDLVGLIRPRAYAIPWIKELKAKGYGVYYLSNFSEPALMDCWEALKPLAFTDGGILSYKVNVVKPNLVIYEKLLEKYELKAEECVFLDDMEANIASAKAVGMQGILFKTKEQAEEELRALGVN